ncbi:MAG: DUF4129 domain-containing protein [Sulfolobales archaeon]
MTALMLLVVPQVVSSSRHLDQPPDAYLRQAQALETLLYLLRACPTKLNYSVMTWDTSSWRTLLSDVVTELFNTSKPIVLVVGGVHLKALALLTNGTEEVRPTTLQKIVTSSVSSLLSMGVPYSLIKEALSNPTTGSILRLFAYASRASSAEKCLMNLTPRIISFVVYVERGNTARARAVAEDVLNSASLFFGSIMVSIAERLPAVYVAHTPSYSDISEEILEKLISVMRESNISIGEALATYSIKDLIDLYEKLANNVKLDMTLQGSGNVGVIATPLNQTFSGEMGLDEDVLRYSLIANPSRNGSSETTKSSGEVEVVSEQEVNEVVSRLTYRVMTTVLDVVGKATFREYLARGVRQKESTPTYTPVNQDRVSNWELVVVALALAASAGGFSQLVLRKRYTELSLPKRVSINIDKEVYFVNKLNPTVRFFWDVVKRLLTKGDVEILPSDTHREIVEKLSSSVDDVTSAALRKLGKLYEVARYSKNPPDEVLMKDLEVLKNLLGM